MSTGSTQSSGRDKLAALKQQQARKERQQKLLGLVAGLVVLALIFVGGLWLVGNNNKDKNNKASQGNAFVSKVTDIPASEFDKVGVGSASNFPKKVNGGTADKTGNKPRMVYYGGEFCPYCGMERWAIVASLSRFGEFKGLKGLVSSEANIPSFDFMKATYTSQYIDFKSWEMLDQQHNKLQTPTSHDQQMFDKFNPEGSFPFMMFGGTHASSGATYSDQGMANKTTGDIADALKDTKASSTQGIIGASNVISAQICQQTGGQPANVCNSAGVKKAAEKLDK